MDHTYYSPLPFDLWNDDCDNKAFLGFTDLLESNGLDYYLFDSQSPQQPPPPSAETLLPPPTTTSPVIETSEVLNLPATPNSSSICSSWVEPASTDEQTILVHQPEEMQKSKKQLKPQKSNQKKQRQQRFAFITKSQVDHLEDGFRWRKYGQKAVKNSPFPRSYYRCTNATCGVKKRVERSSDDQTLVITTYEGRHTHVSPVISRAGLHSGSGSGYSLYPPPAATTFDMPGQMSTTHPPNQTLQLHFNIANSFVHERGFDAWDIHDHGSHIHDGGLI